LAVIELSLIVVMGIVAGGFMALALVAPLRVQNLFGIGSLFGLVGGILAVLSGSVLYRLGYTSEAHWLFPTVLNNLFDLILAGFIGYAVTTFFVLAYQVQPDVEPPNVAQAQAAQAGPKRTAVLYFVPGEAAEYDVRVVARSFDTPEYPQAVPPTLLRPLYALDLKRKYAALGSSPYRSLHFKLAHKVQDRLGKRFKVSIAFYDDAPLLADAAAESLRDGTQRIIVLHARLTNPPPPVRPAAGLESLRLARYGVRLTETAPLWNSDLLPRLFVRRALAATAELDRAKVGLLLIGQGHPQPRRSPAGGAESGVFQRQNQELAFQKRVRQALIRAGFPDDHVVVGWLRWQHPTLEAAYAQLVTEGCSPIFWIGTGLVTDGLCTLYDIPHRLAAPVAAGGVPVTALGPWNDDDLVAEALAERVKAAAE